MTRHWIAALYLGAVSLANGAVAEGLPAALEDLREGDMRKLVVHSAPLRGSEVPFTGEDGEEMTLAAFEGQVVLLNFWATWCAPCRVEMPMLDALQREFGGEDFQVATVATGRNPAPALTAFFEEAGIEALPLHTDPRQALARDFGVLGLPVTVLLDAEGQEIARLQGEADWSSDSARAIVAAAIGE